MWTANGSVLDAYNDYLVAVYKFNNGALTTDSKNSNTLTAVNSPSASSSGKDGYCAYLSKSSNQYFICHDNPNFNLQFFSISVWFKWTEYRYVHGSGIFAKGASGKVNWDLYLDGNNKIRAQIYDSKNVSKVDSSTNPSENTWYHVVVTCGGYGSYLKMYINGVQEGGSVVVNINDYWKDTTNILIGTRNTNDSSYNFNGYIDELVIWNTELSSTEVSALYNSGTGAFYIP